MKLFLIAAFFSTQCLAFQAGPVGVRPAVVPRAHAASMKLADSEPSRRVLVSTSAAFVSAAMLAPEQVFAAEYKLTKDYKTDAENLIENMRYATNLTRGTDGFEDTVASTRKQMSDFVSYYRRQSRFAGAQSFNTLYTAVNTLSGHYASFGNSYPVPAKRRERLTVQYKEIEKYLKKNGELLVLPRGPNWIATRRGRGGGRARKGMPATVGPGPADPRTLLPSADGTTAWPAAESPPHKLVVFDSTDHLCRTPYRCPMTTSCSCKRTPGGTRWHTTSAVALLMAMRHGITFRSHSSRPLRDGYPGHAAVDPYAVARGRAVRHPQSK
eukprot:CAMPEP_0206000670 /NCGR_PEP_ID=MMETSP1464-20131121/1619_1 /ASSEMBLY_ACC=CAM_ASM_001124 /TAXON_ID=119497 /ORGANISM="Exanthemachrysis gayraliae, Strain RCC1523" /LENGTH=325 /DNA_ID=CAMNT_0053373935 /DNA_START=44 /DNA_END=1023 /DNA_ORIENTATION=-